MCNVVLLLLVLLITSATTTNTDFSEQFTSLAFKQRIPLAFNRRANATKGRDTAALERFFVPNQRSAHRPSSPPAALS